MCHPQVGTCALDLPLPGREPGLALYRTGPGSQQPQGLALSCALSARVG